MKKDVDLPTSVADRLPAISTTEQGTAHSPGPWRARPSIPNMGLWCVYAGKHANHILATAGDPYGNDIAVAEANARLIAASPDLLAMLELAVAIITENGKLVFDGAHGAAMARMRAAIVKATISAPGSPAQSPTNNEVVVVP